MSIFLLPPGSELDTELLRITINKDKIESDEKVPSDRRTMQIISNLTNTIHPDIKTTFDVPSDFPDNKMLYLDTKVWP